MLRHSILKKEEDVKHQLLLILSFGLVVFFALLNVHIPTGMPTGAVVEDEGTSALALHTMITNFFEVQDIQFPAGACGDIAKELYGNVAYSQMDTSAGFSTTGADRVATMNFVIDRTARYGTVDMAKGKGVIHDGPTDSFISLIPEAIVRVPKELRTTYYSMDLYGVSKGFLYITHGSFSTPSIDCTFLNIDGQAACNCVSHTITGIRIAGITGLRPTEENV